MCVIFIAFNQHPDYPLILLANRDEYYDRPSLPASYWDDFPDIYAGRDLVGGGTWLGVSSGGRFAAVTNYRDPSAPLGTVSRGELVAEYLKSSERPKDYVEKVMQVSSMYSGFNLLVGELSDRRQELLYYSNRADGITELNKGIYGLSNHLLDTPWPKVKKGKRLLDSLVDSGSSSDGEYFEILSDETLAKDAELPSTGIPFEAEKALSAVFIKTPDYGTRCSTILKFDTNLTWTFNERLSNVEENLSHQS